MLLDVDPLANIEYAASLAHRNCGGIGACDALAVSRVLADLGSSRQL